MTKIVFNAGDHSYTADGVRWPSVSQIIAPLNQLEGIRADVLAAAAAFGQHVHQACHLFNLGLLDEPSLDHHLVPYLAGWKQYLHDTGNRIVESERIVHHKKLKYCGTLDSIVEGESFRKTRRFLVDIKSGIVPRSVGAQTAGYENAYRYEKSGDDARHKTGKLLRRCVQLTEDGKYRVIALHDDLKDWNLFVSCTNIYRHLQER